MAEEQSFDETSIREHLGIIAEKNCVRKRNESFKPKMDDSFFKSRGKDLYYAKPPKHTYKNLKNEKQKMANHKKEIQENIDYIEKLYNKGVEDCLIVELPHPNMLKYTVGKTKIMDVTQRQVLICRNEDLKCT